MQNNMTKSDFIADTPLKLEKGKVSIMAGDLRENLDLVSAICQMKEEEKSLA